jgi:signal transduction histidine kinase
MVLLRRLSMRNRLIAFAAACLVPLLVLIGIFLYEMGDAGREQVIEAQNATAEVVASVLSATLAENQEVLKDLSSIDRLRRMEPGPAQETLDIFSRAKPNLYGLFLLDPAGNVVASSGLDVSEVQADPTFVDAILRSQNLGEPGVSNALRAQDAQVIALTVPVRDKDEAAAAPIGVVGSLLSVERLEGAVMPFAVGDTQIAFVANGHIVASQATDPALDTLAATAIDPQAAPGNGAHPYVDEANNKRYAVYAPVPNSTWGVLVTHPSPAAYAPNREMIARASLIVLATALATLAVAALAAELQARPLRQLEHQVQSLAAGDFTPRDDIHGGGDEITEMSRLLNALAERSREQVRDLEHAREDAATQAEQLRELNRRTVRMQEDERRRIAGEIHDAVSPLITGALYQASALRMGEPDTDGRQVKLRDAALDSVSDLLSKAMEELHRVVFALRPPDLDDIGVIAAIERYIAQVQRSGMNVLLEVEGEPPALSPEVRLAIYRIVQEALHNALRHAAADEAVVRLETSGDLLRVSIRDNGAGFNPELGTRPSSLGLLSMRERAAAIGATLAVMSRPGDGTTVLIERRIEPEKLAVSQLAPIDSLAELPVSAAKRIPA